MRVRRGKALIQLTSQQSSFLDHIVTAERPPGLGSGAVQGSAEAEAQAPIGLRAQTKRLEQSKSLGTKRRQARRSHRSRGLNQRGGLEFILNISLRVST